MGDSLKLCKLQVVLFIQKLKQMSGRLADSKYRSLLGSQMR